VEEVLAPRRQYTSRAPLSAINLVSSPSMESAALAVVLAFAAATDHVTIAHTMIAASPRVRCENCKVCNDNHRNHTSTASCARSQVSKASVGRDHREDTPQHSTEALWLRADIVRGTFEVEGKKTKFILQRFMVGFREGQGPGPGFKEGQGCFTSSAGAFV